MPVSPDADCLQLPRGLWASVQASGTEPLNTPEHLLAMAFSCLNGGAVGVRLSDLATIRHLKQQRPEVPIIGLSKPEPLPDNPLDCVYITPSADQAIALAEAGADIIAMDATVNRLRPQPLADVISGLWQAYPGKPLMADCATLQDAMAAEVLGFSCVSTTLSGYTTQTEAHAVPYTPDFALLSAMLLHCKLPVVLEGRVWTPAHVRQAFGLGARAVVVGSAVSRPQHIVAYLNS